MKALINIILLLTISFAIQKDIKDKVLLNVGEILNLSSTYDYKIYTNIYTNIYNPFSKIFYYIATELDTFPFDISYSFRDINDTSNNISIYHKEQKGNLTTFFFKLEKPNVEKDLIIIDFNVSNIKGDYALIISSRFEELNSNIIKVQNASKSTNIEIYKDKHVIIMFDTKELDYYPSFEITVPSFNIFKKLFYFGSSNEEINNILFFEQNSYFSEETNIVYDNKTYELYPYYHFMEPVAYKKRSVIVVLEPLINTTIIFNLKNRTNLFFIRSTDYNIGNSLYFDFYYGMITLKFDCQNYYQDLFYFTIRYSRQYKYYYSYRSFDNNDTSNPLELKSFNCKMKDKFEYCEANRTTENQKGFYFVIYGKNDGENFIDLRSTFFDESNYTILNPYLFYEYQLNKTNFLYPIVIGNFNYSENFYFEFEIEFLEDVINDDNNINKISINVQLNNKDVNNYLEFDLKNSGISLIKQFSTGNKYYYLYRSNDKFKYGVKSLFFYINHKGKYPNCTLKFGTFKEDPIKYENNLILLNQEKNFTNIYDIFFLSLNLTKVSFLSNDNINVIFKTKRNAFKSELIYYSYSDSNTFNYNINGTYSICKTKTEKNDENITIHCFISKKSNNPLHFILYLNQNYDINIITEIIYIGHFNNSLSCTENKQYIISNNASINDNYYLFISSNKNFNIDDISYNFIDNLDNFSVSYPILESKEVLTSNDKRIYVTIKNIENKNLIGFKTNKIKIPFQIIKTKFDESNTIFIYENIQINKFTVSQNEPLLFVIKINNNSNKLYSRLTTDININYNIFYFRI